jgi:outer membrane protein assembly factor BamB
MKHALIALLALGLCLPLVGAEKKKPGAVLWEFKPRVFEFKAPFTTFPNKTHLRSVYVGVNSSPVIGPNGMVYVTSGKNLYALHTKKSKSPKTSFFSPLMEDHWIFRAGSLLSSPTIGSDGIVYVGSKDGKVYALTKAQIFATGRILGRSATFNKKWEFQTAGGKETNNTGAKEPDYFNFKTKMSSPAIGADGTVYVGSVDKKIYALDGKTGAKKWEFKTGGAVFASPAIGSDGTVYVGSVDKKVYALDGKTGAKKWEHSTIHSVESTPAIGADGTVYVGSKGSEKNEGKAYALDGKTGARKWPLARPKVVSLVAAQILASPAIGPDGTVYVITNSQVYALDGKNGAVKWEFNMGGHGMHSSPVIRADGIVYVGTKKGILYALDGKTGLKRWSIGRFQLDIEPIEGIAIGADGILYVGGGREVYAVKTDSKGPSKSPVQTRGQNDWLAPEIEAAVRKTTYKHEGKLTKADLGKVKVLRNTHNNKWIKLPEGLENLTQLTELQLNGNQLTDVKGLKKLTQLRWLTLAHNQLTDVKGLENLKQLRWLWLNDNQLTDVKGLENLTQLQKLYLNNNNDLTKTQIAELQKALPKCKIKSNPKK